MKTIHLVGMKPKQSLILSNIKFLSKKQKQCFASVDFVLLHDDDNARLIYDPDHSEDEDRFILLGLSCKLKILTVVHCYKDEENNIRIISARKSTKSETKQYKEYLS